MIAQANRLDNGEIVEGSLINNAFSKRKTKEPCYYIFDNSKIDYDCFVDIGEQLDDFKIDPQTLKYSFDNGENFYSENEINTMIRAYIGIANQHRNV